MNSITLLNNSSQNDAIKQIKAADTYIFSPKVDTPIFTVDNTVVVT